MAAVWARARADLRTRWKAWLMLAILVGLAAGGVIAAAAGARRTDTAFPRFAQAERAPNVMLLVGDPTFAQFSLEQVAHLPQVAGVATLSFYNPADRSLGLGIAASPDDRLGTTVLRHKILAGRLPRQDRPDEVLVSFLGAEHRHLAVGDRLSENVLTSLTRPPVTVSFQIVGIEANPIEFPPLEQSPTDNLWATPAFWRAHASQLALSTDTIALRLRGGARDARAVYGELSALSGGKIVSTLNVADQTGDTQRSIHLQAVALWLLAGLLAMVAVLVVAQALARQSFLESTEYPDLRALGMDRAQLWGLGMARAVAVGLVAAPIAVVVAFLLSPLTPIGLARVAEPDPGFAADALALGVGALATLGLVLIVAALPAWLVARSRKESERASELAGQSAPSAVAGVLSRVGARASLITGVRLALETGRGRSAVPVRSTLAGAVIGVAAVATAFGFNASLDHLLATPRLYGAPWDLQITPAQNESNATDDVEPTIPVLQADRQVADVAVGRSGGPLSIQGTGVQGTTFDHVKGQPLAPPVVEGRPPSGGKAEIVLGSQTLRAVHASVGSTVTVSITGVTPTPSPARVVGRAVFPTLGPGFGLGQGALFTTEYALRALVPPGFSGVPPPDTAVIRLAPGADRARAHASLVRQLNGVGAYDVVAPSKPVDLVNFGRVRNLPLVLASFLAVLAAATLAHLLVSSIRRRRRDLAVLKTLGFVPGQVRATVAWQSTTLGVVAVVLGIPLGIAAGRWAWLAFAHQLGIVPEAGVPLLALLAMVPATLVVANLVAVLPGRAAARAQPARVLRSE